MTSLRPSGELDRLRAEILDALRALAEPLERYEQLAERQRLLTARIREVTGKDNSLRGLHRHRAAARGRTTTTRLQFVSS